MEFVLTLFGLVEEGLAGRRWKRWAARLTAAVGLGVALKLGAAEWLLQQYIEHRVSEAEKVLEDVVRQVDLPTTTVGG